MEDEDGCVGVASLPSVFMEREVNEVRRGRPTVALELVQVRTLYIGVQGCIMLLFVVVFLLLLGYGGQAFGGIADYLWW